jgi:hypothetical protein
LEEAPLGEVPEIFLVVSFLTKEYPLMPTQTPTQPLVSALTRNTNMPSLSEISAPTVFAVDSGSRIELVRRFTPYEFEAYLTTLAGELFCEEPGSEPDFGLEVVPDPLCADTDWLVIRNLSLFRKTFAAIEELSDSDERAGIDIRRAGLPLTERIRAILGAALSPTSSSAD